MLKLSLFHLRQGFLLVLHPPILTSSKHAERVVREFDMSESSLGNGSFMNKSNNEEALDVTHILKLGFRWVVV